MNNILHPFKWADSANSDFKQFVRGILIIMFFMIVAFWIVGGLIVITPSLWDFHPILVLGPALGLVGAFIRWVTLP